jgi:hypothetical protein
MFFTPIILSISFDTLLKPMKHVVPLDRAFDFVRPKKL